MKPVDDDRVILSFPRLAGEPARLLTCYDQPLVEAAHKPLVDLVIVNYRSYEELTRCLASLERSHRKLGRITVVDHDSNSSAAAGISARFPWVELLQRAGNEGFATGVNRGVSCVECHGKVNEMEEVYHYQPLSMTFCLDCHRNPAAKLRDPDKITNLNWQPPGNTPEERADWQNRHGADLMKDWKVESLQNCSACHR